MQDKKFQRKTEDFVCEQCGMFVKGDGYTNHCPECLWSKHVDYMPGDRSEPCSGMMRPIGILKEHNETIIAHQCLICKKKTRSKSIKGDSKETITTLSGNPFRYE